MVVIVRWLDLQLIMQSAHITTNVVSFNTAQAMCTRYYHIITLCDKACQWVVEGRWFSPGSPVSSNNKIGRHDIAEILLKVALNIRTLTPNP